MRPRACDVIVMGAGRVGLPAAEFGFGELSACQDYGSQEGPR